MTAALVNGNSELLLDYNNTDRPFDNWLMFISIGRYLLENGSTALALDQHNQQKDPFEFFTIDCQVQHVSDYTVVRARNHLYVTHRATNKCRSSLWT